jgi:hypothetical protein
MQAWNGLASPGARWPALPDLTAWQDWTRAWRAQLLAQPPARQPRARHGKALKSNALRKFGLRSTAGAATNGISP